MTDAATTPAAGDPAAAAAAASASPSPATPTPGGDPKPAAAPGGAAPAGQAPADGGSSAVYRPEGLPDHLLGKDERETLDKLAKAYTGAREAISKFGPVPEAPDKYVFTPAETVAPYLPNVAEDPAFKAAQAAAHKHGLGEKQFAGFVNEFMSGLIAGQMLDDPFSAEKERAIIAGDVQDPAERAKVADRAANDTIAFIDALAAQGKIPKDTADWAKGRTDRGHFIRFVGALRAGAPGIETGGQGAPPAVTRADLQKRMADPRQKTDPAFQAKTTRLYQQVVPDVPDRA
jgi:hypothetical protein